jgi:hypothetical protein
VSAGWDDGIKDYAPVFSENAASCTNALGGIMSVSAIGQDHAGGAGDLRHVMLKVETHFELALDH